MSKETNMAIITFKCFVKCRTSTQQWYNCVYKSNGK